MNEGRRQTAVSSVRLLVTPNTINDCSHTLMAESERLGWFHRTEAGEPQRSQRTAGQGGGAIACCDCDNFTPLAAEREVVRLAVSG